MQTKLRKGNVFTCVCQEFSPQWEGGGVHPLGRHLLGRRCASYWNAFLLQRNFIFIYNYVPKPVKITDTFVILGTPPDYNNHYPNDDDKKLFIRHYLKEKLKITESEPVEDDTFERKSKHLFVQVCKCELVG